MSGALLMVRSLNTANVGAGAVLTHQTSFPETANQIKTSFKQTLPHLNLRKNAEMGNILITNCLGINC